MQCLMLSAAAAAVVLLLEMVCYCLFTVTLLYSLQYSSSNFKQRLRLSEATAAALVLLLEMVCRY